MNRPLTFLIGVGIGAGIALLFAPQSGEELREKIADIAEDGITTIRRKGQRSIRQLQKMVSRSGDSVNRAVDTGRHALDSIADKLA
ncbi:MAG TPA: YtxH domain-containing protein [Candidatus Acidoferrales bacterium]|nr:YtxH domain-containing protein [Candidatus Acidoferrales bacterium]